MKNIKTDEKNVALAKRILHLRSDIDLHRLIGLNLNALQESDISNALLGHIQNLAHGSIAMGVCRMYENAKHNELDTILGIIKSLCENLSSDKKDNVTKFGKRYGNSCELTDPKVYLEKTFVLFMNTHSVAFEKMKKYRDKVGAHSESRASIECLPSHDEFEDFYKFAKDCYEIVSDSFVDVRPADINESVGKGFMKLMKSMGISEPKYDF